MTTHSKCTWPLALWRQTRTDSLRADRLPDLFVRYLPRYASEGQDEVNADLIVAAPELLDAAIAVIERWDSPLWKDLPATAEYIGRLRKAVAKAQGGLV